MPAAVLQMALMAGRIAGVRSELQAALEKRCPDKDWSFITQQIGMFSFTGMTPQQVGPTGYWELGYRALWLAWSDSSARSSSVLGGFKPLPSRHLQSTGGCAAGSSVIQEYWLVLLVAHKYCE